MIKKLNTDKGITLIALVITIIVLLILAGIAISMLSGENGILQQAAKAKTETDSKSTEEAIKLAATAAMTNKNHSVDQTELEKELTNAFGAKGTGYTLTGDEKAGWTVGVKGMKYSITNNGDIAIKKSIAELIESGENVTGKTTIIDENGDQVTIPEGFHLAKDSATTVKEGIVIEDNIEEENKNQFVWIPLKDINEMCEQKNGKNVGILYNFPSKGTSAKRDYTATGRREPDVLEEITYGDKSTRADRGLNLLSSIVGIQGDPLTDADAMMTKWKEQLQNEFDAMIESVRINKGFYVGRYETSFNADKTQMYSKKGATSATAESSNANTWYGLYQYQKLYSNGKVVSSMIWGCQYDQMMRWMQANDIDVTSTTPIAGAERNTARTTGTKEEDQLNKVYDILGNSLEWTLEANNDNTRVYRRRLL